MVIRSWAWHGASTATRKAGAPRREARARTIIRPACFDDYEGISALESANGLTAKTQEEWMHLWVANPAHRELPDWPIGWVLENQHGRIVGSTGNIPSFYYLGGKKYVAAWGRGWVVDSDYRGSSIRLLMQRIQAHMADFHITTTPSTITANIYGRLGWRPPPIGDWNHEGLWVTNYGGIVRNWIAAKAPGAVSQFLRQGRQSPGGGMLTTVSHSLKQGVEIQWCGGFDERYDAFWEELRERKPHLLLSDRSRNALEWHFKYPLEQNRLWVLAAHQRSRLVAYALFEKRDILSFNLLGVRLVDFQALGEGSGLCRAMVAFALERCEKERIHLLENTGCWLEQPDLLNRPAPYHRKLRCYGYLYAASNKQLRCTLQKPDCWYPTYYDGDAIL